MWDGAPPRAIRTAPVTRIKKITQPTIFAFPAEDPNGTALLILPGGGFNYVVPDKEGSEVALEFNKMGISAFVLNYRVSGDRSNKAWRKPLADTQRALRWIRAKAPEWSINPQRVGIMGFRQVDKLPLFA